VMTSFHSTPGISQPEHTSPNSSITTNTLTTPEVKARSEH
jgi:hypothetical protein